MSSSTSISTFYRVFFTIIDPVACIGSVYGYLFSPHYVLTQFTPSPAFPLSLETQILTDTLAGVFLCLPILFAYLLRARPTDLVVWRSVQLGTLMIDFAILGGMTRALTVSNRLDVRVLTQGELGSVVFTAFVAVVRILFLVGVGVKESNGDGATAKKRS